MELWSNSFRDGGLIPADNAFAAIDPLTHWRFSNNRNPHLAWGDVPNGTQSLALFCLDGDAPASHVDLGRKLLAPELPRGEFCHWSLIDIPPSLQSIAEAQCSRSVTAHGKPGPVLTLPEGQLRQGLNDFTTWFASDADMAGNYYGYDGPFPPWNDLRIHHYIFRLYALDLPRLKLEGSFSGKQARMALHGHILDEAQMIGVYSLYPELAATLKK